MAPNKFALPCLIAAGLVSACAGTPGTPEADPLDLALATTPARLPAVPPVSAQSPLLQVGMVVPVPRPERSRIASAEPAPLPSEPTREPSLAPELARSQIAMNGPAPVALANTLEPMTLVFFPVTREELDVASQNEPRASRTVADTLTQKQIEALIAQADLPEPQRPGEVPVADATPFIPTDEQLPLAEPRDVVLPRERPELVAARDPLPGEAAEGGPEIPVNFKLRRLGE